MTTKELRDLIEKKPGRAAARGVLIVSAYILMVKLVWTAPMAAWLICPLLSFILAGAINAAHDCVHNTHLAERRSNRLVGSLWCIPLLTNFSSYRASHLVHHRRAGLDGDTEPSFSFDSLSDYLWALTGVDHWRFVTKVIYECLRGNFVRAVTDDNQRRDIRRDNAAILLWLALILGATWVYPLPLLLAYWVPLLLYPGVLLLFSLPEHYACAKVPDVTLNTRTITSNAIVRFFMWNGGFHAEHHAYPAIPAVRLAQAHSQLRSRFANVNSSYAAFHRDLLKRLWANG